MVATISGHMAAHGQFYGSDHSVGYDSC